MGDNSPFIHERPLFIYYINIYFIFYLFYLLFIYSYFKLFIIYLFFRIFYIHHEPVPADGSSGSTTIKMDVAHIDALLNMQHTMVVIYSWTT